jgi:receptor expression-enhancing protein 1/2/3/4
MDEYYSSLSAFLYPGYASYKTLSHRPASEQDLERWLMYWSVLGCIGKLFYLQEWFYSDLAPLVGVEYVAEWVIAW